jgi:hypothetical protein
MNTELIKMLQERINSIQNNDHLSYETKMNLLKDKEEKLHDLLAKIGTYDIYFAINPSYDDDPDQEREFVGNVYANSLEEAFKNSQNLFQDWNPLNPCRSTSVGDAIKDPEGRLHMVCGMGFKEIFEPKEDLASIADQQEEMKYLE